jgi:hypothetical protein
MVEIYTQKQSIMREMMGHISLNVFMMLFHNINSTTVEWLKSFIQRKSCLDTTFWTHHLDTHTQNTFYLII